MQKCAMIKNILNLVAVSFGLQHEAEGLFQKGFLVPLTCPINKSFKYQTKSFYFLRPKFSPLEKEGKKISFKSEPRGLPWWLSG